MTPRDYLERSGVLAAACGVQPRPGEVRRSLGLNTLVGGDADDLVERWRRPGLDPGRDPGRCRAARLGRLRLVGTPTRSSPSSVAGRSSRSSRVISTFAGLPFAVFEDEQLELVAERVLPRLWGLMRVRREERTGPSRGRIPDRHTRPPSRLTAPTQFPGPADGRHSQNRIAVR